LFHVFLFEKIFTNFIQSSISNASGLFSGKMLAFKRQLFTCSLALVNFRDRGVLHCFVGYEPPAFIILKNSFGSINSLSFGSILIIAESTFGFGQKHFFWTKDTIFGSE
jgi:hypothetical protein